LKKRGEKINSGKRNFPPKLVWINYRCYVGSFCERPNYNFFSPKLIIIPVSPHRLKNILNSANFTGRNLLLV
jgi:hypothetical protein